KTLRKALQQMPEPMEVPDISLRDHVLAVRLAPLGEGEALLLCLDVSRQRELERQRDQLVRDLMHDMKTPLTSILGYARSIESFGDNKDIRAEAVQTIVQESKRLNGLLESMLTLDTINHSRPAADAQCDLRVVVRELEKLFKPVADRRGTKLKVRLTGACSHFPMDAADLYRMLTNLIENALRFSPSGTSVRLEVECGEREAGFRVLDAGPGIDPKHLPHVTERFYRAEDERGQQQAGEAFGKGSGHGMGLAIVQETVNRYGGRLLMANRQKGGLEVGVQIPVRVLDASESVDASDEVA
ncbi:MAG: ATP-binding protein, partial [Mariprofundaceae bacterium]|nr:ATP-binding protein [Mariprofundaceae bacterium]